MDGAAFDPANAKFKRRCAHMKPRRTPILTDHADMSLFAFIRRFRDEVGTVPGHWLIRLLGDLARHYPGDHRLAIDLTALQAASGTGTCLRGHLHAAIDISPMSIAAPPTPAGVGAEDSVWAGAA
ncbi:AraC family transcriptional regulator [Embleya sp. NPDC056575]|uniref:AraC family transcriptional regulator n=1 Tax=unclassified Embleya TaxID=2699296 RepID=UPI003697CAAC